jgi:hypothetical protein
MKIPEFKRFVIRIITEFCGIPSGFPNQDDAQVLPEDGGGDFAEQRSFGGLIFVMD